MTYVNIRFHCIQKVTVNSETELDPGWLVTLQFQCTHDKSVPSFLELQNADFFFRDKEAGQAFAAAIKSIPQQDKERSNEGVNSGGNANNVIDFDSAER